MQAELSMVIWLAIVLLSASIGLGGERGKQERLGRFLCLYPCTGI